MVLYSVLANPVTFAAARRDSAPIDRNSVAPEVDVFTPELGDVAAPETVRSPAGIEQTASGSARRAAGLLLVGVVAGLALTGCGDGGLPIPGIPGTTQGQEQGELKTADTMTERLGLLQKQDKAAYLDLAEANYYHKILTVVSQGQEEAARPMVELAAQALEGFDHNQNPTELRDHLREHLEAIAEQDAGMTGEAARFKVLAQAGVAIGNRFDVNAANVPGGIFGQAKLAAYEEAMSYALELPEHVKARPEIDYEAVHGYAESLAETARLAQEAVKDLPDTGTKVALYDQVAEELYQRVSHDADVLGGEFLKYLEIARELTGGILSR